jgi:hypothetical protein
MLNIHPHRRRQQYHYRRQHRQQLPNNQRYIEMGR